MSVIFKFRGSRKFTIHGGLVFEFMFQSATLSASFHVRAGPGKHRSDAAVTRGRPGIVFHAKKTGASMSDANEEGPQANASLPPDPDHSESSDKDAAESEPAEAEKSKRRRADRAWELLGQWDPTKDDTEVIGNEIARIANAKLVEGGITSLNSRKKKDTDLSGWKFKDRFRNPNTELTVVRYRCPLAGPFKCPALLKTIHSQARVELYGSAMHGSDAHVPAKDTGKYLKHHQREVIQSHIKVNPRTSAAHLRRNIHRTSPEKKIAPEHHR